ncbi:MAG: ribokinase [Candidatus Latescibacteria bacterium]|nr:ribokinase [Candidatus Latescibacterota bacterium]
MNILNFGSLNIDHVYQVDHIVRPGETLPGSSYQVFAGGKGANQSTALARAGAPVYHAGQVGPDGAWLVEQLLEIGVDTRFTRLAEEEATGHAIIQVDAQGQNAIVLYPGANTCIDRAQIDRTLDYFSPGDLLLLQNEINDIPYLMRQAKECDLQICFNPAPFTPLVPGYPLELVDILVVNQTEGAGLAGMDEKGVVLDQLAQHYPTAELVLTLGAEGVQYRSQTESHRVAALPVAVADTTAAGDTFIGYFLAARAEEQDVPQALDLANRAAARCVMQPGAQASIPIRDEVEGGLDP